MKHRLVETQETETGETVYRCTPCELLFKEEGAFRNHMMEVHSHEKDEYSCEKCVFKTNCDKLLEKHINKNHAEWNCEHFDFQGSDRQTLQKHKIEAIHKDTNYECNNCDNKFFNDDELMKHRKNTHNVKVCRNLPHCPRCKEWYLVHPDIIEHPSVILSFCFTKLNFL